MAKRKIEWADDAIDSFEKILDYYVIRNDSKTYSQKIEKQIVGCVERLREQPYLGKPTEFIEVRVMVNNPFLIFYKADSETIRVVLIWDGRRNPDDLAKLLIN